MATATGGHCNRYNGHDDEGDDDGDGADGVNNRDLHTVARAQVLPTHFCLAMATALALATGSGGYCNRYNGHDDEGNDDNADRVNDRDCPSQLLNGFSHGFGWI